MTLRILPRNVEFGNATSVSKEQMNVWGIQGGQNVEILVLIVVVPPAMVVTVETLIGNALMHLQSKLTLVVDFFLQ